MDSRMQLKGANKVLPTTYSHEIVEEGTRHFLQLVRELEFSVAVHDLQRATNYYLRAISDFLALHYPLDCSDELEHAVVRAAAVLYNIATSQQMDATLQAKCCHTLSRLLKRARNVLIRRHFTVPCRPLFDVVCRQYIYISSKDSAEYRGKFTSQYHGRALSSLARQARRFFAPTALSEIFAATKPLFCRHSNASQYRAQALLCTFAPAPSLHAIGTAAAETALSEVFGMWEWLDNSPDWDYHWLALLGRWAKQWPQRGPQGPRESGIDWTPHLPVFYTHFLRILGVERGNAPLGKIHKRKSPLECAILAPPYGRDMHAVYGAAKVAVYTLDTPTGLGFASLSQLFTAVQSYYHPSNGGKWTNSLATLLGAVAKLYSMRRGGEERAVDTPNEMDVKFVDMLLGVLPQALFSKSQRMVMFANRATKHLAYLSPQIVFTRLMPHFTTALDTLTATHQAKAALDAMSTAAHPLLALSRHPDGAAYLPGLLTAALPGIDSNDQAKTAATIKFLYGVFANVPISDRPAVTGLSEAAADSARQAGAFFSEWVELFLERVFRYVADLDKPQKSRSDGEGRLHRQLFKGAFVAFFTALSPQLYAAALDRFFRFAAGTVRPNALGEFGALAYAVATADPAAALAKFVPFVAKKLLGRSMGSADPKINPDLSSDEIAWHLRLLTNVIRADGSELVRYQTSLVGVLRACLEAFDTPSPERKVAVKHSAKLLKHALRSLTETYPVWGKCDRGTGSWGDRCHWTDLKIAWHVPGKDDLRFAVQLLGFAERPLALLDGALANIRGTTTRDELWGALVVLRSVVAGAALLLPPEEPLLPVATGAQLEGDLEEFDEESAVAMDTDERQPSAAAVAIETEAAHPSPRGLRPLAKFPVNIGNLTPPLPASVSGLRRELADKLSRLSEALRTLRPDDTATQKRLCRTADVVVNMRQLYINRIQRKSQLYNALKDKWRCFMHKAWSRPRALLIERAHLLHLRRTAEAVSMATGVTAPPRHKQLIGELSRLCVVRYQQVRNAAQIALVNALKTFAMSTRSVLLELLAVLDQSGAEEGTVLGAVGVLSQRHIIRRVCREWRLMCEFMLRVCKSSVHDRPAVQMALYQLFVMFAASYYAVPVQVPLELPTPEQAATLGESMESLEAIFQELSWRNDKNAQLRRRTVATLLALPWQQLHWRYQVMVLTCLLFLFRRGVSEGAEIPNARAVARLFLENLTSEVEPVRTVAVCGVTALARLVREANPREVVTLRPPEAAMLLDHAVSQVSTMSTASEAELSEAAWRAAVFFDKIHIGWNGIPQECRVYHGSPALAQVPLESTVADLAEQAVRRSLSEVEEELYSAFSDDMRAAAILRTAAADHRFRTTAAGGAAGDEADAGTKVFKQMAGRLRGTLANISKFVNVEAILGGMAGGSDNVQQAAAGIIAELVRSDRQWPTAPFTKKSEGFSEQFARLWTAVFGLPRGEQVFMQGPLVRAVQSMQLSDDRGTQCAIAEFVSGTVRGARHWSYSALSALWSFVVPLVSRVVLDPFSAPAVTADALADWLTAFHFSFYNRDPRRIRPLVALLHRAASEMAIGSAGNTEVATTSAVLARRLQCLQACFAELAWKAADVAAEFMLATLRQLVAHPFRQVRAEIGKLIARTVDIMWEPSTALLAAKRAHHTGQLAMFFSLIANSSLNSGDEQTTTRVRDTVLHWLRIAFSFSRGVGGIATHLPELVVPLFSAQSDADQEIAKQAKQVAGLAAQTIVPRREVLRQLVYTANRIADVPQWHARAALLPFLQLVAFNHMFLLTAEETAQIHALVHRLLADPQVEVRETVASSFAGILRASKPADVVKAAEGFRRALATATLFRKAAAISAGLAERHAMVLGASAVILSAPYHVPAWMPSLLVTLARHANEPNPLGQTVRRTFGEFWRTHQDNWDDEKSAFSSDQLDVIRGLVVSQSYFM